MAGTQVNFTTPVGRLVAGSLYEGNDKDAEGRPLVTKSGPQAGQPRLDYYFAIAVPKTPGQTHFAQTEWGAKLWQLAHTAYPAASQNPKFAWKVIDGDSQIPNGKGRRPCDREGYPGHWVLNLSSGFAPRILRMRDGTNPPQFDAFNEPGAVKLGYFVQVNINADFNGSQQQPGLFLNHSMVCFSAYGPEIFVGPDPASAGFGAAALPPGATMTPPANFAPPVAAVPGVPVTTAAPPLVPGVPGVPTPGAVPGPQPGVAPPVIPAAVPPAVTPPAIPVAPNPGFVQQAGGAVPGVPAVPGAPAVPGVPAAPVRRMLPPAGATTYEQFIAGGWTDALLVQHGMMAA